MTSFPRYSLAFLFAVIALTGVVSFSGVSFAAGCANTFNSTIAVPAGYGAAYNLFSTAKEQLIQGADCTASAYTIQVGSGDASHYVYKQGYSWNGTEWTPLNLTSTSQPVADAWFVGKVSGSVPAAAANAQVFVVGYVCEQVNGAWKCGCHDSECAASAWQIQIVNMATSSSPTPTLSSSASPTPASTGSALWKPTPGTTWQWQLTGTLDQNVPAQVFDIDVYDNSAEVIASLHQKGKKVICYMSAGSYEDWRPDAGQFPAAVLGNGLDGWPGEKWLDVRRIDLLTPIMAARMDMAKQKGCDAIEPDNIDGYSNNTGFPLTGADQIAYNRFLVQEAHKRGMSIGLKNDLDQISQLVDDFDFAVNEQCFQYDECDSLTAFVSANKAVFTVEYDLDTASFCSKANSMRFSSMKKKLDLDASFEACWK